MEAARVPLSGCHMEAPALSHALSPAVGPAVISGFPPCLSSIDCPSIAWRAGLQRHFAASSPSVPSIGFGAQIYLAARELVARLPAFLKENSSTSI